VLLHFDALFIRLVWPDSQLSRFSGKLIDFFAPDNEETPMSLTLSKASVPAFVRGLNVLSTLLKKGEEHAAQNGIAPETLLGARLADDMLPLSAQVQRASDASKFTIQRLTGGEAPKFDDVETTFAQLQERIAKTIAWLESVDTAQIDAGTDREVSLKFGSFSADFSGESYLLSFALPNFYFHLVTAYDILRNQGVNIGKRDYLGAFDASTSA
jgi:hypothetical protein